ncbi:MAG: TIGR00304 family membrane protein [Nitrososphaeria archaeon]
MVNLQLIGASLIFIGMLIVMLATIVRLQEIGDDNKETKFGGVIMIGPIPIAFGNSRRLLQFLLAIVIVIFIIYLIFAI